MKKLLYLVLMLLLAACSPANETAEPTANFTSTSPTETVAINSRGTTTEATELLSDNPDHILIQYDVHGGLMDPGPGTSLARWTLYGDGFLVWTETGTPTPGFNSEVWIGHLNSAQIAALLANVDEGGFWDLEAAYQAPTVLATVTSAAGEGSGAALNPAAAPDQPSATILVAPHVDRRHQVTIYPAGWNDAPAAFRQLQQKLEATRPSDAQPFEPQSFRLMARSMPQLLPDDPRLSPWPFENLSLAEATGQPLALSRENGLAVADFIAANGPQVVVGDQVLQITLSANPPRDH